MKNSIVYVTIDTMWNFDGEADGEVKCKQTFNVCDIFLWTAPHARLPGGDRCLDTDGGTESQGTE